MGDQIELFEPKISESLRRQNQNFRQRRMLRPLSMCLGKMRKDRAKTLESKHEQ